MSFHASEFAQLTDADLDATVAALTDDEAEALRYDWSFWARPEQRLPDGDWINWLILAGRGMGKTRIGSETVRQWVKRCRYVKPDRRDGRRRSRHHDHGESGILAICPKDERPRYNANKRMLARPNGAISLLFTAEEPDRFRGKQHMKL
jgi:phage terminase large subunit-like protein